MEDLDKLLEEYGIEDIDLDEDNFDMLYVLPTPEDSPSWLVD
jgi:hypothetical protein